MQHNRNSTAKLYIQNLPQEIGFMDLMDKIKNHQLERSVDYYRAINQNTIVIGAIDKTAIAAIITIIKQELPEFVICNGRKKVLTAQQIRLRINAKSKSKNNNNNNNNSQDIKKNQPNKSQIINISYQNGPQQGKKQMKIIRFWKFLGSLM